MFFIHSVCTGLWQ